MLSHDTTEQPTLKRRGRRIYYRRSLADRLWEKVNKDGPTQSHCPELGPCWIWTASFNNATGYGQIYIGDELGISPVPMAHAHRAAYALTYGPIPQGLYVLHRCDFRPCVRPSHLFLGTHLENIADCIAKGRNARGDRSGSRLHRERMPRGEAHHAAKLTANDVQQIREMAASGLRLRFISEAFGVEYTTIYGIARHRQWRHI